MSKLRKITVADIRLLEPCYDPTKVVPENWQGTVLDILDLDKITPVDKIWVIRRFISDKTNRLFAVWCAREALKLVKEPDPRSIAACDVAEKYANGLASKDELADAAVDAYDAATADAFDAATAAAYAAAYAAAADAADAATAAAAYAADAYADAAYADAATRKKQLDQLKLFIIEHEVWK